MADKELSEVERLEAAIEAESAVKEKLEQSLARDIEAQKENEKRRNKIAYAALTKDHNPRGKKKLDESESTLAKLAQRVISTQRAIEVSGGNISALRERRNEAQRRERMVKYVAKEGELISAAAKLEAMLGGFGAEKAAVEGVIEEMDKLSFGLFETDKKPHKNVAKALNRALQIRLNALPYGYSREVKKLYLDPIQEIFERILKGSQNIDEAESKPNLKQTASEANEPTGKKAKAASGE